VAGIGCARDTAIINGYLLYDLQEICLGCAHRQQSIIIDSYDKRYCITN
jgi:hypothetical protein